MLDDTRNLIGDIASGKIKDARLELLSTEISVLQRKLSDAEAEISSLRVQLEKAQFENENMKSKIPVKALIIEPLPQEAIQVLAVIAESGKANTKRISEVTGIEKGKVHFYLDKLFDAGFTEKPVNNGLAEIVAITPDGRAFHYK